MGEMADMMINGLLCHICGVYLDGEEPGYPRYCSGCKPKNKSKKEQIMKNIVEKNKDLGNFKKKNPSRGIVAVKGVQNYLKGKSSTNFETVIRDYNRDVLQLPMYHVADEQLEIELCTEIQKDFGAFIKWFKETYKK